jgi:hypothetical protein
MQDLTFEIFQTINASWHKTLSSLTGSHDRFVDNLLVLDALLIDEL